MPNGSLVNLAHDKLVFLVDLSADTHFVSNPDNDYMPGVFWDLEELKMIDPVKTAGSDSQTTGSNQHEPANAREALIMYFALLAGRKYEETVNYYGGSYDALEHWNPPIDKNDKAGLLKNGCEVNGLSCFPVRRVVAQEKISPTEHRFTVEFTAEDGKLFSKGPFPGDPEDTKPQTQFVYTVKKNGDRFVVMELPVYIP